MSRSKKSKAVALRYNADEDAAPVVIASGYGTIAEKIIDIAEQKGIPVFRDDSAASLMCMLEVGTTIPPELYEVVAALYCQLLKTASEIKGESSPTVRQNPLLNRRYNRLDDRRAALKNNLDQEVSHEIAMEEGGSILQEQKQEREEAQNQETEDIAAVADSFRSRWRRDGGGGEDGLY